MAQELGCIRRMEKAVLLHEFARKSLFAWLKLLKAVTSQKDYSKLAGNEHFVAQALNNFALNQFYSEQAGKDYGVDGKMKNELVRKFIVNTDNTLSGTSWLYHVELAREILSIPSDVKGDVVECGCWKGASTASLSLVCKAVGRKLIVCDSFEGLPDDAPDAAHRYTHLGMVTDYGPGMYSGRLDEVKDNIAKYGDISVCEFVKGFFSDTLKTLNDPVAFAFLDVDLLTSMKDCVKYIWPLLAEGGLIYTDDSCDMEVVKLWFDERWWNETIGISAPGYVGSGCGLPLSPRFSSLGYAVKVTNPENIYKRWQHPAVAMPDGIK